MMPDNIISITSKIILSRADAVHGNLFPNTGAMVILDSSNKAVSRI